MSIEMLNQFTAAEFFKQTAPLMGERIPHTENHPTIWDQVKLQQEPKWEGALAAFGATHGAKPRQIGTQFGRGWWNEDPSQGCPSNGQRNRKGLEGEYAPKPKLELQHSDLSEHIPFGTFLAQCLKEYGVCKLMHLQKEVLPSKVKPSLKWIPKPGLMLSANMPTSKENAKTQQGGYTMEALKMILFGGAAGTGTSGRSLAGIEMQTHEGGPSSFKVKRLSDTLKIEFRGAHAQTNGPDWWFRVQMVFWRTRKTSLESTRSTKESLFFG